MWIEIFVHYIKRVSSIVRFKLMHPLYFHHFTFFGSLIYPPLDDLQGRRGIYLLLGYLTVCKERLAGWRIDDNNRSSGLHVKRWFDVFNTPEVANDNVRIAIDSSVLTPEARLAKHEVLSKPMVEYVLVSRNIHLLAICQCIGYSQLTPSITLGAKIIDGYWRLVVVLQVMSVIFPNLG